MVKNKDTVVTIRSFLTFRLVIAESMLSKFDQYYQLKESVTLPVRWVEYSISDPDHTIYLCFALSQPKFWFPKQTLYEISNLSNEYYSQHMSKEEVEVLVAPNQDSINVIKEWITVMSLLLYDIHYDRRVTWLHWKRHKN